MKKEINKNEKMIISKNTRKHFKKRQNNKAAGESTQEYPDGTIVVLQIQL